MKKYTKPTLELETIYVEDTLLASSFGSTGSQPGDIDVELF